MGDIKVFGPNLRKKAGIRKMSMNEVKDTLICDFDGYGFSEGSGEKFRKWTSRLESGETRITLLELEDGEIFFNPGLGPEEYYMGDPDSTFSKGSVFPNAAYTDDFDSRESVPQVYLG